VCAGEQRCRWAGRAGIRLGRVGSCLGGVLLSARPAASPPETLWLAEVNVRTVLITNGNMLSLLSLGEFLRRLAVGW